MALENKAQKAKREALAALPEINAAMAVEPFYAMCSVEVLAYLVKNELAVGNETITNEQGCIATRLTEKGVEKVMSETATEAVVETVAAKPTFQILNVAIPVSTKKRAGRVGGSKYPFDSLEVGASFFVPVSAEVPNPLKTMASTVVNANARYSVPVFEEDGTTPKMRTIVNKKNNTSREDQLTQNTKVFAAVEYTLDGVQGALVHRKA